MRLAAFPGKIPDPFPEGNNTGRRLHREQEVVGRRLVEQIAVEELWSSFDAVGKRSADAEA